MSTCRFPQFWLNQNVTFTDVSYRKFRSCCSKIWAKVPQAVVFLIAFAATDDSVTDGTRASTIYVFLFSEERIMADPQPPSSQTFFHFTIFWTLLFMFVVLRIFWRWLFMVELKIRSFAVMIIIRRNCNSSLECGVSPWSFNIRSVLCETYYSPSTGDRGLSVKVKISAFLECLKMIVEFTLVFCCVLRVSMVHLVVIDRSRVYLGAV